MELNSAMFARAGRCGYILKPEFLRKKGAEKDKVAALRSEKYRLEVEVRLRRVLAKLQADLASLQVISAQQLPRPPRTDSDSNNVDPFVEVSLYVPGVVNPQKRRTPVVLYVFRHFPEGARPG